MSTEPGKVITVTCVEYGDTWKYDGTTLVTATATTYGNGCGTPALSFTPSIPPIIGTLVQAYISNAPTPLAGVSMGWSDSYFAGLPLLPLGLSSIGMPGCAMLQSNDVFGLPTVPLRGGAAINLALPPHTALLGQHVYLQAYCFAPGANALEVIASNGIDWLIGNQ